MPLGRLFDGFVEYTKRVSPTGLVHLERCRYSVPASFANRPVSICVHPDRLVLGEPAFHWCNGPHCRLPCCCTARSLHHGPAPCDTGALSPLH